MDTEKLKSDLEAAHQQELRDLEQTLHEKLEKEIRNLEHRHRQEVEEIQQQHNVRDTERFRTMCVVVWETPSEVAESVME